MGIVMVVSIAVADGNDPSERMGWWGWVLVAVQIVPLVWRRRWPVGVLFVSGTGSLAFGVANLPDPAIPFTLALALYSVAAYRPRRVSVPMALLGVLLGGLAFVLDDQADPADVAVNYLVGIGAWVVGDSRRASSGSEPPGWPSAGRTRRGGPRPRNGSASPATCTTSWPTTSA